MKVFCWMQGLTSDQKTGTYTLYNQKIEQKLSKKDIERYTDLIYVTKLEPSKRDTTENIKYFFKKQNGTLLNINLNIKDNLERNNSLILFIENTDIDGLEVNEIFTIIKKFVNDKLKLENFEISQYKLNTQLDNLKKKVNQQQSPVKSSQSHLVRNQKIIIILGVVLFLILLLLIKK